MVVKASPLLRTSSVPCTAHHNNYYLSWGITCIVFLKGVFQLAAGLGFSFGRPLGGILYHVRLSHAVNNYRELKYWCLSSLGDTGFHSFSLVFRQL